MRSVSEQTHTQRQSPAFPTAVHLASAGHLAGSNHWHLRPPTVVLYPGGGGRVPGVAQKPGPDLSVRPSGFWSRWAEGSSVFTQPCPRLAPTLGRVRSQPREAMVPARCPGAALGAFPHACAGAQRCLGVGGTGRQRASVFLRNHSV